MVNNSKVIIIIIIIIIINKMLWNITKLKQDYSIMKH